MTSFIKFERNCGDDKLLFSLIDSKIGTIHIDVKGMSERVSYNLVNFPKTLSPHAAVNSISLLQQAKITLTDRNITVAPPSDNAQVWAVWLSVFSKGEHSDFREKAFQFLENAPVDSIDIILQIASCNDAEINQKALAKAQSFPNLTLEQRSKLYDFYVDTRLLNAPVSSEFHEKIETAEELFWRNYCLQAIKRIPSDEHSLPKFPQNQIPALVSLIGFRAFKLLETQTSNTNQEFFRQIRVSLVCRGGLIESWYEEYRYWIAIGDNKHAEAIRPNFLTRTPLQMSCRTFLCDKENQEWTYWQETLQVYIPPMAADYQGGVGADLMDQIELFLKDGTQKVFLLQGDAGSGKTTFARYLSHQLFLEQSEFIPIYISLPQTQGNVNAFLQDLFAELQESLNELKQNQPFLFILDGYDELGKLVNLYTQNQLHQWKHSKCLITCRTQFLEQKKEYRQHFISKPSEMDPFYKTSIIRYVTPFNERQVERYLQHAPKESEWTIETYQEAFEQLPKELYSNPFLLRILVQYLPQIQEEHSLGQLKKITIYEKLIDMRLEKDVSKQGENKQDGASFTPEELKDFSQEIAITLWTHQKTVIDLKDTFFKEYKSKKSKLNLLAEKGALLRHSDALTPNQETCSFQFIHDTVREYLLAEIMMEELLQKNHPLTQFRTEYLSEHPVIVDFIVEMLWSRSDEEREQLISNLFDLIERSKSTKSDDNDDDEISCDAQTIKASSNAATILARAGIGFSGRDLRNVRLDRANLNGGLFHHVNLQGACLKKATLLRVQLVHTNLRSADLTEVEFGEMLTMRAAHDVHCIAHHPTKDECAAGLSNGNIIIWDSKQAQVLRTLKGHEDDVRSVCYSPSGDRILSGSGDNSVRQWSSSGGAATHIFKGHEGYVTSVCYSPSGDRILSGSYDNTVRHWSSLGGTATHIFKGHEREVTSVCYSPSGDRILSGSDDKTVRQWSSLGGTATYIFKGHEYGVTSVCYSPSGDRILSGSYDNTVRQWSSLGGPATHIFKGHEHYVTNVCYSPTGDRILSCSWDTTVLQWSSLGGSATHIFRGHKHYVTSICYSFSGDRILSGSDDKTVRQWSSLGGAAAHIFKGHEDWVTSVCYSPSGDRILSGSYDKTVSQWSSLGGSATHIFKGHEDWVTSVCYSPKVDQLLSGSDDKTIRQWSSLGGAATHIFKGHERRVTSVCYSPSGDRILSGSRDTTVRQWSSQGGAAPHIFKGHELTVTSVCYSPSGDRILSGSEDNTVRQSSLAGAATQIFKGHEDWVTSVCYSPSGNHILSGSHDTTVSQWSSSGGAETHIFKGHEKGVTSVCYSPSGDRILSGSWDKTARIWEEMQTTEKSKPQIITESLSVLRGHHSGVYCVAWSKQNQIVTGSSDHTIAVWKKLDGGDVGEMWAMVWRSGYTPLFAIGCQIDDHTNLSPSNRALIEQRSTEE